MGIQSGLWGSTSAWGSFLWGREEVWIPCEFPIQGGDLKDLLEDPTSTCMESRVLVEVEDTVLETKEEAPEVIEVTTSMSLDNRRGGFTMMIANSLENNHENVGNFYFDKLDGKLRYRFRIKVGYKISGSFVYATLFTGIGEESDSPLDPMSDTDFEGTDYNLLLTGDGTEENFTGTMAGLVYKLLLRSGVSAAFLAFEDREIGPVTYLGLSSGEVIRSILNVFQNLEIYFDRFGIFHARQRDTLQSSVYVLDAEKNTQSKVHLRPSRKELVTSLNVVGGTDAGSGTFVDATKLADYGRIPSTLSNPTIETAAEAEAAAEEVFERSNRRLKFREINQDFLNPILIVGGKVDFKHPLRADEEILIRRVDHRWEAVTSTGTTEIDGDAQ